MSDIDINIVKPSIDVIINKPDINVVIEKKHIQVQMGQSMRVVYLVDTLANRDLIPANIRYEGFIAYVQEDTNTYQLKGGIDNTDWIIFGGAVVGVHNDLSGLQGGDTSERYHLTNLQVSNLNNQSGVNTGDQDLSGYATNNDAFLYALIL